MCQEPYYFIFSTKSDTNFGGLCEEIVSSLDDVRRKMSRMPIDELYALKEYADNRGSNAKMWADAELQRRDFLLKKWSIIFSLLAIIISVVALCL